MIERQHHQHAVAGLAFGHQGKNVEIVKRADMRHDRRLGQAGRARREHFERRVFRLHIGAHGRVRPGFGLGIQRGAEILSPIQRPVEHPGAHRIEFAGPGTVESLGQLAFQDDLFGLADIEAMGQGMAGELVIEQGSHHTDLGEAEPDGDILPAIAHEESDRIARLETLVQRPMGDLVGPRLELAVGNLARVQQGHRIVGETVDRGLDVIRHPDTRPGAHLLHRTKHAQHAAHIVELALQRGEQTHR